MSAIAVGAQQPNCAGKFFNFGRTGWADQKIYDFDHLPAARFRALARACVPDAGIALDFGAVDCHWDEWKAVK
jgi:hypothetical protein